MGQSLVFVSHATTDKNYAQSLKEYIERTIKDTKAFVASDPASISSGGDWFDEILKELSDADALVIVFSRNARSSLWLGFELGHFWRKLDGKKIHCVFDPTIELPSPLNERQAKDFTDVASMASFFTGLASDLRRHYELDDVGITKIVDAVPEYDAFATWKSLLANGEWLKEELSTEQGRKTVWTSLEDMAFQIENAYTIEVENFSEPWVKNFPDRTATSYNVNLNVSGQTVKQVLFVSLDGGRYFVPMPEVRAIENGNEPLERRFYYDRTSLKYLLANVVGYYYSFVTNLEEFAQRQDIEII